MKVKSVEHFFQNHRKIFIDLVFRWYPINIKYIEKNIDSLTHETMQQLCQNPNFYFDRQFLHRFIDNLDWSTISQQIGDGWTKELLEEFQENYVWHLICQNPAINWDTDIIYLLSDRLNLSYLCSNPSFPWSNSIIEKFKTESGFSWEIISGNTGTFWTEELIKNYENDWSWYLLSENISLPWSLEFIDLYSKKWDWFRISGNPKVPWNLDMIAKYFNKINWNQASTNHGFPWSMNLIKTYLENARSTIFDWRGLGSNPNLHWTEELIDNLPITAPEKEEIWIGVGYNPKFDWTEEKIDRFYEKGGREGFPEEIPKLFNAFSQNENLNWSLGLLKRYENYWNWGLIFSNRSIPWDDDILRFVLKQSGRYPLYEIFENPSIPWKLELIDEFEYCWSWEKFATCKLVWEKVFKDNLTSEFVASYLSCLKIDQYKSMKYVYQFGDAPKYFKLKSKFTFGKYEGEIIEKIFVSDPSYIEFCFKKVDFFVINETDLEQLRMVNKTYSISKDALMQNEKKATYYSLLAQERESDDQILRDYD